MGQSGETLEKSVRDSRTKFGLGYVAAPIVFLVVAFGLMVSLNEFIAHPLPLLLGPGAYGIKTVPGPTTAPGPDRLLDKIVPSQAVFFSNGSARPSKEVELAIRVLAKTTECAGAEVLVIPWVSSLQYVADPQGKKNLLLAKSRGEAVKRRLLEYNPQLVVKVSDWDSFDALRARMAFDDSRADPKLESPNEPYNRRVDIQAIRVCSNQSR